jgi:hypothetical protein
MKMNETAVEGQPGAMQPLKFQPLAGRGRAWCRVMMHARRQRRRCFWCRRPLAPGPGLPSSPTLDHLIPRSTPAEVYTNEPQLVAARAAEAIPGGAAIVKLGAGAVGLQRSGQAAPDVIIRPVYAAAGHAGGAPN